MGFVPIPFSFPNPVDEVSARLVACGAIAQGLAFVVTRSPIFLVTLAYGFAARVAFGPRFSPLGRIVTVLIRPHIGARPKFVAGPPKRFAQGMGLVFSSAALLAFVATLRTVSLVLISLLLTAAILEAGFAVCLGCIVFRRLMRLGVIPESICESCADISGHVARLRPAAQT